MKSYAATLFLCLLEVLFVQKQPQVKLTNAGQIPGRCQCKQ